MLLVAGLGIAEMCVAARKSARLLSLNLSSVLQNCLNHLVETSNSRLISSLLGRRRLGPNVISIPPLSVVRLRTERTAYDDGRSHQNEKKSNEKTKTDQKIRPLSDTVPL